QGLPMGGANSGGNDRRTGRENRHMPRNRGGMGPGRNRLPGEARQRLVTNPATFEILRAQPSGFGISPRVRARLLLVRIGSFALLAENDLLLGGPVRRIDRPGSIVLHDA